MKKIVFWIIIAVLFTGNFFYFQSKVQKIAYVNVANLYNGFTYKKEMETKFNNIKNIRQAILDSLKLDIQILAKKVQGEKQNKQDLEKYQNLIQTYQYKNNLFSQNNEELSKEYNQQIFNQINQYVKDFGKEYGYDYIIGANSNGSLMYAKENKDITDNVIDYINKAYMSQKK